MIKTSSFKQFLILLIMGGCTLALTGQDQEGEVIKPYVSKIKATPENSQIVLTWENPGKVELPILIYKHKESISADNFAKAEKIAALDFAKESYVYYPPDTTAWFFAVVYAQSSGEPDNVFISARNVTTKAVKVESIGSEEDMASRITGIKVSAADDSIVVSFKSSKSDRELILYRNIKPMLTTDDLLGASFYIALDKQTTTYKDFPIPEIEYYYAVLDAGMVKIGRINLVKNENATTRPVRIRLTAAGDAGTRKSSRSVPLPLLSLVSAADLSSELANAPIVFLPEEKEISEETRQSISGLLAAFKEEDVPKNEIQILDIDTADNKTGEAYSLQQILNNTLLTANYDEAEKSIFDFLRIQHTADIDARAHFYLGQAYFFQKRYRESFLEFLIASDRYYAETQPWMNDCYTYLEQY